MEARDKFGRRIYSKTFVEMKRNGDVLSSLGYEESAQKPNLFYFKAGPVIFFGDMRGTEEVPIWEDTAPLFYWRFPGSLPLRTRQIMVYIEYRRIQGQGVSPRLSFDMAGESSHEAELLNGSEWDEEESDDTRTGLRFCDPDVEYCRDEPMDGPRGKQ